MGIYGQDWASYQSAKPDVSGLSFAFIKVTEGLTYTNPEWTSQRDDARGAGLVVGYYHYPHMANSPQAEADHFLSLVQPHPGEMLCLDWEGYDPANLGVSHTDQLAYKEAFLHHLKASAPHNPVGMYCNVEYWKSIDTTGYFQDFLWIATSGVPAGQPGIIANWLFHQYGDKNVDQDYCRLGSTAELRTWAMGFQPAPTHPAWPGRYLKNDPGQAMMHGSDVQVWQERMHARGWQITVDGWYGPASDHICRQFQQEKHLAVDGVVGNQTWDAAWVDPIS